MAISLKVNNSEFVNYINASLNIRLDALCNQFSLTATNTKGQTFPFQLDDECEIYVSGVKLLTGRIEVVDGSYNKGKFSIRVSGRDKTADLLDSKIYNLGQLAGSLSLVNICEKVIAHIGADISVKLEEGVRLQDFNIAEDKIDPQPGDNAFSFLEGLAMKRNVLMSSDPDGNLLLTENAPKASDARLQNKVNDQTSNNVIDCSFSYDNTNRFSTCICYSQLNPVALNNTGGTDLASVVAQSGQVQDPDIHKGRQYVFQAEVSSSDGQLEPRAKWQVNIFKARGIRYEVEVKGHTIADGESELWTPNTLVQVRDDFAAISSRLLVESVSYSTSSNGDRTRLILTDKDAYSTFVPVTPSNENDTRDIVGATQFCGKPLDSGIEVLDELANNNQDIYTTLVGDPFDFKAP